MTVLRSAAETIVRRLRAGGFEAVFAGGCKKKEPENIPQPKVESAAAAVPAAEPAAPAPSP